jgi:non-ribosomal peptide synthetase component E (peptide arylation enzyme)
MTLCDLLAQRAREYTEKTFLFFQDQQISYRRLEQTADRLANGLAGLGIKQRDNICLLLPNRPEFLYSFFGVMKAGRWRFL